MRTKFQIQFLIIFLIGMGLFFSCATTKKTQVAKITPQFNYTPHETNKMGAAGITIALLNPQYVNRMYSGGIFETFRRSMANDFEELLSSKGFNIRGPFDQIGKMLFSDKENSDFILEVEILLDLGDIERTQKRNDRILYNRYTQTPYYYTYSGAGVITANVNLTAMSPRYSEKLWRKFIELPQIPFNYQGSMNWEKSASFIDELNNDNVVFNAFSTALMNQYQNIFELLDKQIEIEEMKMVQEEAEKVKKRK